MRARAATVYPEIQVTDLLSLPVGKPFAGGGFSDQCGVGRGTRKFWRAGGVDRREATETRVTGGGLKVTIYLSPIPCHGCGSGVIIPTVKMRKQRPREDKSRSSRR